MKTITATYAARNFSRVLDILENGSEEIIILRKKNAIAKLVSGAPRMTALEALADLHRTLPDVEGKRWLRDASKIDRPWQKEKRDPWE
jgi:antitoxin (DNA-binding transcriptional repressor) of toxin-antitoxin stability system